MRLCNLRCQLLGAVGGRGGLLSFVRRFIRGFLGGRLGMLWVCDLCCPGSYMREGLVLGC